MLKNFIIIGPKRLCGGRKKMYLELILQVGFLVVLVTDYCMDYQKLGENSITQLFDLDMVIILRNMRLIKYLSELRDGMLIIETLRYLTKPILSKFFFVYLVFYMYAYLGMVWFGGKVTFEIWD